MKEPLTERQIDDMMKKVKKENGLTILEEVEKSFGEYKKLIEKTIEIVNNQYNDREYVYMNLLELKMINYV